MMDRRIKLSLLTLVLLGSVLGAHVIAQAASFDPLVEFRTADGALSIPGGKLTPELQHLLFPGPAPTSYWTYSTARSFYPTLAIEGTEHAIVRAPRADPQPLQPVGTDSLRAFFDALLRLPREIVSWFDSLSPFMNAAAADRFLVLDDAGCTDAAIATDVGCWSATSGGAGGAGVPTAVDAMIADGNSGTGTGTLDANMSVGSLNTTGFTQTIDLSTFDLETTATGITHAGGKITIGITASQGIRTNDGGDLNMSGSANIDCQGAACKSYIDGDVNISSATAWIAFGSSDWTVRGTWTNNSTSASWDAGTGTVIFNPDADRFVTFAGSNLSEPEFNHVTFTSSGVDDVVFTMLDRGLRVAGALTIVGAATKIAHLEALEFTLRFDRLTMGTDGHLVFSTPNTFVLTPVDFDTSAGDIILSEWTTHDETSTTTVSRWTFNPSDADATLTITFGGLMSNSSYRLLRDGSTLATGSTGASGSSVTFAIAGGWSSHEMLLQFAGQGAGGPPPPEPPTPPPPVVDTGISWPPVFLASIFLGALFLFIGQATRSTRIRILGLILVGVGIAGFLYLDGWL